MIPVSTFAERLRTLLDEKKLSQADLSRKCGLSRATLSRYLQGQFEAKQDSIYKIARATGVSEAWLMGAEVPMDYVPPVLAPEPPSAPETHASNLLPFPEMPLVPIIGRVACGQPITAEENVEGYTGLPSEWHADFILICQGSSMEPKIMDGDAVAIRKVEEVHNGQIAAVRIGDEATLKKVYRYSDRLELRPINTDFEPIILWREDMNNAAIEGRAVGLCRGI